MSESQGPQQAFGRAAGSYDEYARLQTGVANALLEQLAEQWQLSPSLAVDLGAGTAALAAPLRRQWPGARWLALDIALPMLEHGRKLGRLGDGFAPVCADAEQLPLADASVDLLWSSFALQWCDDPMTVVGELHRVLRPGGCLALALPVAGTLDELEQSWAEVDQQSHTRALSSAEQWMRALAEHDFLVESRREVIREHYPDLRAIGAMLRGTGAHHVERSGPVGLTGRRKLARLLEAYERRREPEGLPVTWQVLYVAGTREKGQGARNKGQGARDK